MQISAPNELVVRCLAHEEAAWEEFVRRYANLIYATILKVQLPPEDVEEAFQSSMVAIHQQLPKLREPDRIVSWIVGISHRQAVNRIRARTREQATSDTELLTRPDETALPDADLVKLERIQHVREGMAQLSDRCQRLIQYLFFADPAPDYETISKTEGIPIGSIGPTRARCLDKLRTLLDETDVLDEIERDGEGSS